MSETPLMQAPPEWLQFRRDRDAQLTEPYGWLTISSFHWVPEGPAALPGLPGWWSLEGPNAVVAANAEDGWFVVPEDGGPVSTQPLMGQSRRTVGEKARVPWLRRQVSGITREVELLRRSDRLAIRERAETSRERETFAGVATYPYDPALVVRAQFTPHAEDATVQVATHRPELKQTLRSVGEVTFDLLGRPQRLVVTAIKYGWSIEFHDPTNGDETPAWRQIKIDEPGRDGTITIDFNNTILMWFAFTDHATCPAPVDANTLTVPVRGGERAVNPPRTL
ncbi:DUF1684 domain-containing protein [Granulicoccus phenolivorans]|uniref:DUF1684 domain-containing protein n=1 Tax=Granulicoccus phenolivorans TaxID=266854 RepID=UPI000403D8B6|nr:DUF1684 domain-containing protein [Granulicoccus phenolivorans]